MLLRRSHFDRNPAPRQSNKSSYKQWHVYVLESRHCKQKRQALSSIPTSPFLHAAFEPGLCCPPLLPWRPASGAASARGAATAQAGAATRTAAKKNRQRSWRRSGPRSKLRSTPVRQRELVSEDLAQGKEADHKTPQHKPADRRAKKSARRRELVSEDLAQEKGVGQGTRRR